MILVRTTFGELKGNVRGIGDITNTEEQDLIVLCENTTSVLKGKCKPVQADGGDYFINPKDLSEVSNSQVLQKIIEAVVNKPTGSFPVTITEVRDL